MLSFAVLQAAHVAGRWAFDCSARVAINIVSCAAGALALLTAWRLLREPRACATALDAATPDSTPGAPWWAWLLVASAGFTTIFYGHIETYAMPVAALLLHLLALRRALERRWPPWTILATFSLLMAFHLIALFIAPVALAAAAVVARRRARERKAMGTGGGGRTGLREAVVNAAPLAAALAPAAALWIAVRHGNWGAGELAGEHFVYPLRELLARPWRVVSSPANELKAWFIVWNGGVAAALAPWVFAWHGLGRRRDPFTAWLLGYFYFFLIMFAVWNPDAGERDFDLFCFPWVVATLAVARRAARPWPRAAHGQRAQLWRAVVWGLMLGGNVVLFLLRPAVFAEFTYRGYGTIELEIAAGAPRRALVLLDDSIELRARNGWIPAGSHEVRVLAPGVSNRAWIAVVRPGETLRYRLDERGLRPVGTPVTSDNEPS